MQCRLLPQNLYESIKNEPFKIPEDDGNDLTHTFFNPDREGWLLKLGESRPLGQDSQRGVSGRPHADARTPVRRGAVGGGDRRARGWGPEDWGEALLWLARLRRAPSPAGRRARSQGPVGRVDPVGDRRPLRDAAPVGLRSTVPLRD